MSKKTSRSFLKKFRNDKQGELLEILQQDNQQPSETICLEGSETIPSGSSSVNDGTKRLAPKATVCRHGDDIVHP